MLVIPITVKIQVRFGDSDNRRKSPGQSAGQEMKNPKRAESSFENKVEIWD